MAKKKKDERKKDDFEFNNKFSIMNKIEDLKRKVSFKLSSPLAEKYSDDSTDHLSEYISEE